MTLPHWQEVANAVSAACPNVSPAKIAIQCHHKMEKLRKRYRAEIQRARNLPVKKFNSLWIHFKLMDSMEKGPSPTNSLYKLRRNGIGSSGDDDGGSGSRRGEGEFRIRIPNGVSVAKPDSRFYLKFSDEKQNPNSGYGAKGMKEGSILGKREREREKDSVEEMVNVIKVLADGFVRTKQMKMEMARETESMRMKMEMKRTEMEMILESQHRIVENFANVVSEQKKKTKRMEMEISDEEEVEDYLITVGPVR